MKPTEHYTTIAHTDLLSFVLGEPVTVDGDVAENALRRYRVRSESRRGYVLVVGGALVRLSEDDLGVWTMQKLPHPSWIAEEPTHQHAISPVTLSDGWDVLVCSECGREW